MTKGAFVRREPWSVESIIVYRKLVTHKMHLQLADIEKHIYVCVYMCRCTVDVGATPTLQARSVVHVHVQSLRMSLRTAISTAKLVPTGVSRILDYLTIEICFKLSSLLGI